VFVGTAVAPIEVEVATGEGVAIVPAGVPAVLQAARKKGRREIRKYKLARPGRAREIRTFNIDADTVNQSVTPQTLKGTKGNEGNDAVKFPQFLHFPVEQAEVLHQSNTIALLLRQKLRKVDKIWRYL
jgi:hypothetical protein